MIMLRLLPLLIGYAFGCIQTAFIVGKVLKKIDVREHGSGNAGTSNVIRVIGKRAGLLVFICDVLKAIAAFVICAIIFSGGGSFFPSSLPLEPGLYAGLGVILGHNFPFFLKFRGGKGVASTLGVMLALDWRAALAVYLIGVCILAITRYISLTSLTMAVLFPVLLLIFSHNPETIIIALIMAALIFILHRGNIQRLLSGTERKLVLTKN
ncbi:MAG: glycerol-3-phosphate 1-O-acyltransferase PlsY [Firmicutes bacterium]|nr:glycerol-3-phosphate 1-O-acyltransferase PlsY [Bacillota bacterium]